MFIKEINEYIVISCNKVGLKACVHYFLTNFYLSPNDTPSKTMKDVYFI